MKHTIKALLLVTVLAASGFSQSDTAKVPVRVNVAATVKIDPPSGSSADYKGATKTVAANQTDTLLLLVPSGGFTTSVSHRAQKLANAPAAVSYGKGKILLDLNRQSFNKADIALFTVNGKQIMRGNASASAGAANISRANIAKGVYLLSVKGVNGNTFATRMTHNGGNLNISVAFGGGDLSLAKQAAAGDWVLTASAEGYNTVTKSIVPVKGVNPRQEITLSQPPAAKDFTETVNGVSFDMIYISGGTFTLGCEKSSGCAADTKPVSNVKVSPYFIMKTEVSGALWRAVMGTGGSSSNSSSYASMTFYEAMDFTCRLSELTGKKYHMQTEAEFEFAVKKYRSSLEKIGPGGGSTGHGEWAYNSWVTTQDTTTDNPVGPHSGAHTQKTRRDSDETGDPEIGRQIRSIEGFGPALRLVVSAETDFPPKMVPPCDMTEAPHIDDSKTVNSYRDPRWITGSGSKWEAGAIAIGSLDLRVWEDGTARLGSSNGQWFTSNNIAFVFVSSSNSRTKFAYIFVDEEHVSIISDKSFMSGGFIGRGDKVTASNYDKPTVSGLKTGAELAAEAGDDYKMVDMEKISTSHKNVQDSRLLDGTSNGWFQDNRSAGGTHHYRKDVDADEFRFTVNAGGGRTYLAVGTWFTVNNTFLRVIDKNGYVADYLYAIVPASSSGGYQTKETFYHNSFQGYERADFRMFEKTPNGDAVFSATCGSICSGEIPKGGSVAAMYANDKEKGQSTFVPAPCPTGGCR